MHKSMVCSVDYHDKEKACQGVVTPLLETLLGRGIENFRNPEGTSAGRAILSI